MNTAMKPKASDPPLTNVAVTEKPKQVYIPAAILYNEALEAVAGTCDLPLGKVNVSVCYNGLISS